MKFALTKSAIVALVVESLFIVILLAIAERKPAVAETPGSIVMMNLPAQPDAIPEELPKKEKEPAPKKIEKSDSLPPKKTQPLEESSDPQPKVAENQTTPETASPVDMAAKPIEQSKPDKTFPAASVSDAFKGSVRAAVQSAVAYPLAAKLAHVAGKTKVSFDFLDGKVSNLSIVTSSGFVMLDEAALKAVEAASYPAPPSEVSGKTLPFEVWVRFFSNGTAEE